MTFSRVPVERALKRTTPVCTAPAGARSWSEGPPPPAAPPGALPTDGMRRLRQSLGARDVEVADDLRVLLAEHVLDQDAQRDRTGAEVAREAHRNRGGVLGGRSLEAVVEALEQTAVPDHLAGDDEVVVELAVEAAAGRGREWAPTAAPASRCGSGCARGT